MNLSRPKWRGSGRQSFSWMRTIGMTVFAVSIFGIGVMVGQGRISFGSDSAFHNQVSDNIPEDLDYSSVEKVYDSLKSNFDGQLELTKLMDGLKSGIAKAAGDPYTEYFNVEAAKSFEQDLNGTFTGIGAELSKDPETNVIVVVAPISGFPAERAGLKPKDVIAEIDGKSAFDLGVGEAVNRIRGEAGTVVKLKIIRDQKEQIDLEITREQIVIPSVITKTLDGNIGYIKITRFSDDTTKLVTAAAEDFQSKVVNGIVLDMRSNPGGLLEAAVKVSSLWLKNKPVLTERRDGEVIKTYNSVGLPTLENIPTVILINGGSASASEITAGALHDNKAATIIGEKSFGKGSVQQLVKFNDGSELKVTIARWYTPDGKNIDKEGISPDEEVKLLDEQAKAGQDPQLDAALAKLKK